MKRELLAYRHYRKLTSRVDKQLGLCDYFAAIDHAVDVSSVEYNVTDERIRDIIRISYRRYVDRVFA